MTTLQQHHDYGDDDDDDAGDDEVYNDYDNVNDNKGIDSKRVMSVVDDECSLTWLRRSSLPLPPVPLPVSLSYSSWESSNVSTKVFVVQ